MIPDKEQAIRNIIEETIIKEMDISKDDFDKGATITEMGGDSLLFISVEVSIVNALIASGYVKEEFELPVESPFREQPKVEELIDWVTKEAMNA